MYPNKYYFIALGNAPEGTVESVKSITATDLQNFLNQHVVKKNVVVVGTGPVDHEDLVQVTSDGFSSLGDSKAQQSKSAVFVGSDIQFRFDSMRVCFLSFFFNLFFNFYLINFRKHMLFLHLKLHHPMQKKH